MKHDPDFLIIGAARCGTSSLFANLKRHPRIIPPAESAFKEFAGNYKEVHFFDKLRKFQQGVDFYRSFFLGQPQGKYFFEATPNYLYCPNVPSRVKVTYPNRNFKFIVMLRNPVDRAWSHYCGWKVKCKWSMSVLGNHRHEVIAKGIYHLQLKRWFKYFNRDQFLIIRSEDFFANPLLILKEVFHFIGVEEIAMTKPIYYDPIKKERRRDLVPIELRRTLKTFYKPHNNELEELLQRSFAWDKK